MNCYEAVMVMDDDIIINGSGISRLFEIREEYDLWLLQPAFDPGGKINHHVTRVNPSTFMRYTNFVEVTCPLFRKDKLDSFMEIYDPVLVGYGVDWWFLDVLGPNLEGNIAVVDAISCINPHDSAKGGHREIDRLQKLSIRQENWEVIKKRYTIQSEARGLIEYGFVEIP